MGGKPRAASALMNDGNGNMVCIPGKECRSTSGINKLANLGPDQGICSTHQKPRSLQNLQDNGDGTFSCKIGYECSTGDQVRCSIHGKSRVRSAMLENGDGTFVCLPGKECRGGKENAMAALAAMSGLAR